MIIPIITAFLVAAIVYFSGILLFPNELGTNTTGFTRKQLKGLGVDSIDGYEENDIGLELMRNRYQKKGGIANLFYNMPFVKLAQQDIVRAGLSSSAERIFIAGMIGFVAGMVGIPFLGLSKNAVIIIIASIVIGYLFGYLFIKNRIKSRIKKFSDQFPDALDIIVRSVKSGFPLNAAVNMVAESMAAPASEEFKQMSDEVVHGSTMVDALARLANRMQAPDIRFFVVVLTLQQEVGGNLAEVLSNLSSLIRKRKMMKKKIHAITSEGRFTGWLLGSLPVLVTLAIHFMSPDYLKPLFETPAGWKTLAAAVGSVTFGVWIIRRMVDFEI